MTDLHTRLAKGHAVNGWCALPSPVTAEIMARQGFDLMTVDLQHGLIDYQMALTLLQVLQGLPAPVMARVPWNEPGIIGKMLDAGIEGVIVPMVNTVAEAEAVVRAGRYAPLGARSIGPVIAGLRRRTHLDWSRDGLPPTTTNATVAARRHPPHPLALPPVHRQSVRGMQRHWAHVPRFRRGSYRRSRVAALRRRRLQLPWCRPRGH